ncbi:3-hydroxyisobutyrate dehydrogenase [Spirochaetia bacterium]|nr:3-hydroxyisobutyrate dehydrogenase [Spirochaetia bacterium]
MGMKIGFIGLGRMGGGVCGNFIKKGFDVAVYDANSESMKAFSGKARLAANPEELFRESETVLFSLPSSVEVEALCDKFLACGVAGKAVIDLSTSYPLSTKKLQKIFAEKGGIFLDSPLMGNPQMAQEGTISVTVGGDEKDFNKLKPVFEAFTSKASYVGGAGSGHLIKLALNFTGLMYALTYSQIFPLMEKLGVKSELLFEMISGQKSNCGVFQFYGQKVRDKDYHLDFALQFGLKDLSYVKRLYEDLGCPAFILDGALDLLRTGVRDGRGTHDFSEAAAVMRDYLGI